MPSGEIKEEIQKHQCRPEAFSLENLRHSQEGEFVRMRDHYYQFVQANHSHQNSKGLGDMTVSGGRRDLIGQRGITAAM